MVNGRFLWETVVDKYQIPFLFLFFGRHGYGYLYHTESKLFPMKIDIFWEPYFGRGAAFEDCTEIESET